LYQIAAEPSLKGNNKIVQGNLAARVFVVFDPRAQ